MHPAKWWLEGSNECRCRILACWKLPVTQQGSKLATTAFSLLAAVGRGGCALPLLSHSVLDSNWERSRCHSLLWSLLLVYQVHPVSMSARMNCGPQSSQQLLLVYHLLKRGDLISLSSYWWNSRTEFASSKLNLFCSSPYISASGKSIYPLSLHWTFLRWKIMSKYFS